MALSPPDSGLCPGSSPSGGRSAPPHPALLAPRGRSEPRAWEAPRRRWLAEVLGCDLDSGKGGSTMFFLKPPGTHPSVLLPAASLKIRLIRNRWLKKLEPALLQEKLLYMKSVRKMH